MKLVIFSSIEAADDPRLFFKVVGSAAAAGYEVVIIAQPAERALARKGIRIEAISSPRNRLERAIRSTWRVFFRALRERADIYHFADPEMIPLGILLRTLARRPVVYDLREYHGERIRQKFWLPPVLRVVLARLYEWFEATFLHRFAGIAAVNEDLAGRLSARRCRTAVVPNYAPPAVFSGEITDDLLKARFAGKRLVVYVGGMSEDRGITQAVRSMALVRQHVPNAKLLLVGPFHRPGFENDVRGLVEELALDDAVDFLGRVPHPKVPACLTLADVGLCLLQPTSRRYEQTEPIKYFEYAALGVPEVVSDLPALRRLVEENRDALLVDPTDIRAIAAAIVQLLQNRELASTMGARGRRAFVDRYNRNVSFERLRGLYEDVMSP